MTLISIGFTGTQLGMSQLQKDIVAQILQKYSGSVHHGDCIGADAEFHELAVLYNYKILIHPPENPSKRAFKTGDIMYPPKEYIARNHDIVNSCQYLIACPGTLTEVTRSGTWATIRYARRKDIARKFTIILPNGRMGHDTHGQPNNIAN